MEDITLTRKITQDNFTTEKVDAIQNNLLGSYDEQGNYFIAPQIIEELIVLPKQKKNSFANSLFCVGDLLGYGEIAFELEYNRKLDKKEQAVATLYVLEEVDKINGYLQNTIKTKISEYRDEVTNFIEQSYAKYHINISNTTDISDEGKERKLLEDIEEQDSFIIAKKQFSLQLDKLTSEKCLDAYGKYFTYRFSTLSKMNNNFSKAVINQFNEEYERIEKFFLKDKNYKILNELLDKCIEEISGTGKDFIAEEQEFNDIISSAMENFSDSINNLHEKLEKKALNMLDKDDREKMEDIIEAEAQHNKTIENTPEKAPIKEEVKKELVAKEKEQPAKEVKEEKTPVTEKEPKVVQKESPKEAEPKVNPKEKTTTLDARVNRLNSLKTKAGKVAENVSKTANDDFISSEVATYFENQSKEKVTTETKQEEKAKPKSYEQLFSYLNEQNKIKNDEIALRNQRNKQIYEQTQAQQMEDKGRDM